MIQQTTQVYVILSDCEGIVAIHRRSYYAEQELAQLGADRKAQGWRVMPTEDRRNLRLQKGDAADFITIKKYELK